MNNKNAELENIIIKQNKILENIKEELIEQKIIRLNEQEK